MKDILKKTLAKQLGQPHGILGTVILRALNKKNTAIITETINLLDLKPNDTFLDIGFGGGLSFEIMENEYPDVKMHGLEISENALKRSKNKFKSAIKDNKLELKEGSVHRIPYPDNHFNHIISINTVYFWEDVPDAFTEVKRVLKPGGTFVLSIREKETLKKIKATKYGFHFYETEDLIDALETTGFTVILHKRKDYLPFLCIEGEKEQALN